MKLGLNEDQAMLRESFSKLLRAESPPARVRTAEPLGYDPALWAALVAFGIPAMRASEAAGGGGMSLLDAALIAEEAGRHLVSGPLIEAMVAGHLLGELGGEGLAWLEKLSGGEAIV